MYNKKGFFLGSVALAEFMCGQSEIENLKIKLLFN